MSSATGFPVSPDAAARRVRTPVWRITIAGRDVTRDITPVVTAVEYTDHAHGESDDVKITVADVDGRWRDAWYPTKADRVEMWIGYDGSALVPCGRFEIDGVKLSGPPDTVTIKGLAIGVIPTLRTRRSTAHEGQTLDQVVQRVAARHALTVVGTIEPIVIERMTQRDEDDLTFLTRVAEAYGYVFSVRGTKLVFYSVVALRNETPIATLRRRDVTSYDIEDKARDVFKECVVSYHDPKTNSSIKRTVAAAGITTGNVLKISPRVENEVQADAKGRAALRTANATQLAGTIDLEGDPRIVSGTTVELVGWGKQDGAQLVVTSRHRLTRDAGYTTSVEFEDADT